MSLIIKTGYKTQKYEHDFGSSLSSQAIFTHFWQGFQHHLIKGPKNQESPFPPPPASYIQGRIC